MTLLKGTLAHFWLWRWLHLNGTWTMCKDTLAEFMTAVHLIFVGSATFFSRPQHLRGQFDILTLPIWTFDRATKKLRAYMMYWSVRLFSPHFLQQSATTFTSPDRWSKWQWRCSSRAPHIHVDVFNTSNLKITPSGTRHGVIFHFFSAEMPSDLQKPFVSLGAPAHKGRDPAVWHCVLNRRGHASKYMGTLKYLIMKNILFSVGLKCLFFIACINRLDTKITQTLLDGLHFSTRRSGSMSENVKIDRLFCEGKMLFSP